LIAKIGKRTYKSNLNYHLLVIFVDVTLFTNYILFKINCINNN